MKEGNTVGGGEAAEEVGGGLRAPSEGTVELPISAAPLVTRALVSRGDPKLLAHSMPPNGAVYTISL